MLRATSRVSKALSRMAMKTVGPATGLTNFKTQNLSESTSIQSSNGSLISESQATFFNVFSDKKDDEPVVPQTPAKDPTEAYERSLQRGDLKPNPSQRETVEKLQQLFEDITEKGAKAASVVDETPAATAIAKSSFFNSLFNKKPQAVPGYSLAKYDPSKGPRGLYIYGGVGCGKTMMMDMFFDTVQPPVKKVRKHFHSFMLETHRRLHQLRTNNKASGAEQVRDPLQLIAREFVEREGDLLCLDEFQVTDVADAMILKELFSGLFANGCVVVSTSNRKPDDLYLNGINRDSFVPFIGIMKDFCEVVPLENLPDYRLLVTNEEGVYHTPLNRATRKNVDRIFNMLSAGAVPHPMDIDVMMGRKIHMKEAVPKRVAKVDFEELCSKALGAADYMAIAKEFPTLVLTDVPILHFDRREVIRRFITLLDVLYEHRVKVIISADAPPHQLFRAAKDTLRLHNSDVKEDEGSTSSSNISQLDANATKVDDETAKMSKDEVFASARAVSRLVEMASKEYLRGHIQGTSKDTPSNF